MTGHEAVPPSGLGRHPEKQPPLCAVSADRRRRRVVFLHSCGPVPAAGGNAVRQRLRAGDPESGQLCAVGVFSAAAVLHPFLPDPPPKAGIRPVQHPGHGQAPPGVRGDLGGRVPGGHLACGGAAAGNPAVQDGGAGHGAPGLGADGLPPAHRSPRHPGDARDLRRHPPADPAQLPPKFPHFLIQKQILCLVSGSRIHFTDQFLCIQYGFHM